MAICSMVLFHALLIVAPMIFFPTVLLTLILNNHLPGSATVSSELPFVGKTAGSLEAYYVNFSATSLLFIASSSSTVAFLLLGPVMFLCSYLPALDIANSSKEAAYWGRLPTPYQVTLLIGLLSGSPMHLWQWFLYVCGWKKRKVGLAPSMLSPGVVMLIALTLSIVITVTDTWFHVAANTVSYTRTTSDSTPDRLLSRGLSLNCRKWLRDPFNINTGTGSLVPVNAVQGLYKNSQMWLRNSGEAYQTAEKRSSINQIATFKKANTTYAYVTDTNVPPDIDFNASSFAVATECTPHIIRCFRCPNYVAERRTRGYNDPPLTFLLLNDTSPWFDGSKIYTSPTNPFSWGVFAQVGGWNMPNDVWRNNPFGNDLNIITGSRVRPNLHIQMICTTTVFDLTYSQTNGSITSFDPVLGNQTLGALIGSPIFPTGSVYKYFKSSPNGRRRRSWTGFGFETLQIGMRIASAGRNSHQIAQTWSTKFSETALASATGVLERRAVSTETTRTTLLVAVIPKAPLYLLLVCDFLYAVLGITLAVLALQATLSREDVEDVQIRLTVPVLAAEALGERPVAGYLKSATDMFEELKGKEPKRVGVKQTNSSSWFQVDHRTVRDIAQNESVLLENLNE